MPRDLVDALRRLAAKNERSVSGEMRVALAAHIANEKRPAEGPGASTTSAGRGPI
jgi:plasmid stability protein